MKRERIRVVYSIISSRIDHAELAERPFQRLRDHGHADPGAARLPRAAAPAIPPRTRVAAPYRSCSACARPREQQRASGKRRALRTTSWPWFVLARAPPRHGREEVEAQIHAAGGCSACWRASSDVVRRICAPRAARTRRIMEVDVLLCTADGRRAEKLLYFPRRVPPKKNASVVSATHSSTRAIQSVTICKYPRCVRRIKQ